MVMRVIVFIGLLSVTACGRREEWAPFEWQTNRMSGRQFERSIILVPVVMNALPYRFVMQLDTGASRTVVYENTLEPFLERHPEMKDRLDPAFGRYINVDLVMGGLELKKINIGIMKNYGSRLTESRIAENRPLRIGTIGADLFAGRILIIDYPGNRMLVAKTLPGEYAGASFQAMRLNDGRPVIPFTINGRTRDVLFDTGASVFPLVTTEKRAAEISENGVMDFLDVTGWEIRYSYLGRKMNVPISCGHLELKPAVVYYDEHNGQNWLYNGADVWGLTGNYYFWDRVVVVDFKNKRFGVMP
jgi:hypothetical protein